ncbi:MAG: cyclodeaminase/cyclohydrolase family protein [Bacteroidota bacterium]
MMSPMIQTQTINDFLMDLSSSSPAPGGGSVAALSGALGASLVAMVCQLTIGKKKYAEVEPEMREVLAKAETLRDKLKHLIDEDTSAFNEVMDAYRLPKETDEQKRERQEAIQKALRRAVNVPLSVMQESLHGMSLSLTAALKGNRNSVSDAGVSALMFLAASESAALNVRINLSLFDDAEEAKRIAGEAKEMLENARRAREEILQIVEGTFAF